MEKRGPEDYQNKGKRVMAWAGMVAMDREKGQDLGIY